MATLKTTSHNEEVKMLRTTKILKICLVSSVIALIAAVVAAIVAVTGDGDRSFADFIVPILTTATGIVCVLIALKRK